jgi:hypothetical protein
MCLCLSYYLPDKFHVDDDDRHGAGIRVLFRIDRMAHDGLHDCMNQHVMCDDKLDGDELRKALHN